MKSRPYVNSSKSHKIKRVRELTKEGDYLKENLDTLNFIIHKKYYGLFFQGIWRYKKN